LCHQCWVSFYFYREELCDKKRANRSKDRFKSVFASRAHIVIMPSRSKRSSPLKFQRSLDKISNRKTIVHLIQSGPTGAFLQALPFYVLQTITPLTKDSFISHKCQTIKFLRIYTCSRNQSIFDVA